jgi:hypothetical protein
MWKDVFAKLKASHSNEMNGGKVNSSGSMHPAVTSGGIGRNL